MHKMAISQIESLLLHWPKWSEEGFAHRPFARGEKGWTATLDILLERARSRGCRFSNFKMSSNRDSTERSTSSRQQASVRVFSSA